MSDDLIAFLKDWYEWATNGAPESGAFCRYDGLCNNSPWRVRRELKKVFGVCFPFGESDYYARESTETQHECPNRLAWVRERLIEAGELVA